MGDNNTLKMKFKLNQMEFELEGNQDIVTKQFENFKAFVTDDLLPRINNTVYNEGAIDKTNTQVQLIESKDTNSFEELPIPSLKEIALKGLPKTETDWLLIYCYFASDFGKDTFTKEKIKALYEQTNRKNDNRVANLSNNIKSLVSRDFIGVHNDDDFLIKEAGIKYAMEIIKGNSNSKSSSTNKSKKLSKETTNNGNRKNTKVTKSTLLDRSLNLYPEGTESLIEFSTKFNCDSTPKFIVIIVYYLKEILKVDNINMSAIYTCLNELNIRIPSALNTVINNTKNRNGWLEYDSLEDIDLSIKGRNAIKFDLPKKDN
ncbi:hypothetical protein [Coprobacter fastidiosus]|uniref:Uncharacterized protein n=1 Tax=Coprobacter fastidiosus NSB1 = JCM 33896 TaxID=1349822 RepID=A0A495WLK4_9BACT|nr:hypothetical protein [Coprobacter fastidiosus]ERM89069.1 hypothetical protein NSB1T_11810 [Coprobacter fastidiosus NSB1 = JCM 33896]RKT61513.1 hypothetical protein BC742_0565 [Coprobacter fastidiosus NSB1 = JCM 33896]BEG61582.1 hypothetical protein Cfast33896_05370 [Coprobacter fastidiosus]